MPMCKIRDQQTTACLTPHFIQSANFISEVGAIPLLSLFSYLYWSFSYFCHLIEPIKKIWFDFYCYFILFSPISDLWLSNNDFNQHDIVWNSIGNLSEKNKEATKN